VADPSPPCLIGLDFPVAPNVRSWAGTDRPNRDAKRRRGFGIRELRPIAEGDDLRLLESELVDPLEDCPHCPLIIDSLVGFTLKRRSRSRWRQLRYEALLPTNRSLGIAQALVCHSQELGPDRISVESNFIPAPPRL